MIYLSKMKAGIVIAVILVVVLAIGIVQRSRLAALKEDTSALEASASGQVARASSHRSKSLSEGGTTRESDPAASAHMQVILAITERNFAIAETWRNPATRTPEATTALKESMKNEAAEMWPHFAALNHRQVLELIDKLQSSPHVSSIDKPQVAVVCVERLIETNVGEALHLILKLTDLAERERYLTQAFTHFSMENPGEAVRWFDELSEQGELATRTPELLESVMLAEARHDPARAVSGFRSSAATAPDSIAQLGAKLASELRNAGEHQALLAAMRGEQAKESSPVLAKIRAQYVANLARKMHGWPVEEATALMDFEFETGEKIAASQLISASGLAEADRWATWFSKINQPANNKHPLVNFFGSWVRTDAIAAGNWLDEAPSGDLKTAIQLRNAEVWFPQREMMDPRRVCLMESLPHRRSCCYRG